LVGFKIFFLTLKKVIIREGINTGNLATTEPLKAINMYLYGASGHCKVIIDIINESKECSIDGIVDDSPKLATIFNIPVLNADEIDSCEGKHLIVSIGDNSIRKRIVEKTNAIYKIAIHPTATISSYAKLMLVP
jgi:acetyltransferase EpsM